VTCDKVQSRLSACIDGILPEKLETEIKHHLAHCPSCQAELERLIRLSAILRTAAVPDVPPFLADRIVAHGQQQLARETHGKRLVFLPQVNWLLELPGYMKAAAAVVLLVGLSAGVLLGLSYSKAPISKVAVVVEPETDPVSSVHPDFLSESPGGSPAQVYLALASSTTEGR
jgi:anti-sigma factor RsiW